MDALIVYLIGLLGELRAYFLDLAIGYFSFVGSMGLSVAMKE